MPLQEDVSEPPETPAEPLPLPAASQPESLAESLTQALGPEWLMVHAATLGGEPIDLVLLHPQLGIALLQVAPRWTVDAPERLRHRLDQARFGAFFHGHLPVVHRMLKRGEGSALPRLLAEAFAGQPGLDLPAGDAWLRVVHRALLARPKSLPDPPQPMPPPASQRALRIAGGLGLAGMLAATAVLARPGTPPERLPPEPLMVLAKAITPALDAAEEPTPLEPLPEPPGPGLVTPTAEHPATEARAAEPVTAEAPPIAQAGIPGPAALARMDVPSPPVAPLPPPPAPAVASVASPPHLVAVAILPQSSPEVPQPPSIPPPATPAPALIAPPPAPPPPPRPLTRAALRPGRDPDTLTALLRRGEALLALGDVSGARRFFERVADAGDPAGALAMGRTHDPAVLAGLHAWGIAPDLVAAASWYRRTRELELTEMTETTR